MKSQPKVAKFFIGLMALGGLTSLSCGLLHMHPFHHAEFATLLVLAVLASRLKVQLPGLHGNMSVNLPFFLIAVVELGLFEALLVALFSTAAQCFPKGGGKPKPLQLLFNVSTASIRGRTGRVDFSSWLPWHSQLGVSFAAFGFSRPRFLPGPNDPSRNHHLADRGRKRATDMVEHLPRVVPLLRA